MFGTTLSFYSRTQENFNIDMEDNSIYKERKSRERRGSAGKNKENGEKEFTCVHAYNDAGYGIKR